MNKRNYSLIKTASPSPWEGRDSAKGGACASCRVNSRSTLPDRFASDPPAENPKSYDHSPCRTGSSIFEMIAAISLLSVAMGLSLPFFSRLAMVRQDVADRELAVHEVRNLVELAYVSNDVQQLKLSEEVSTQLEEPQLMISQEEGDELNLRKTNVGLTWINQAGQRTQPVALSYWNVVASDEETSE